MCLFADPIANGCLTAVQHVILLQNELALDFCIESHLWSYSHLVVCLDDLFFLGLGGGAARLVHHDLGELNFHVDDGGHVEIGTSQFVLS